MGRGFKIGIVANNQTNSKPVKNKAKDSGVYILFSILGLGFATSMFWTVLGMRKSLMISVISYRTSFFKLFESLVYHIMYKQSLKLLKVIYIFG